MKLSECFEKAKVETEKKGVFFLSDEYIDYVNSLGNCISKSITHIKEAAGKARENKELSAYVLFVYHAMQDRKTFMKHIKEIEFPEGESTEFRLLPFLAYLPIIPDIHESLSKKGVPEDVISATLRQFEDCLYLTEERTGKLGLLKRYFDHMQLYVDEMILNIGRLRFERIPKLESDIVALRNKKGEIAVLFNNMTMNASGRIFGTPPETDNKKSFEANVFETDTDFSGCMADEEGNCQTEVNVFLKIEWEEVLRKGDSVLSVHIPAQGALTEEACEESYRRAKEIFAKCYPEFKYKAFHCYSWMIDPQLVNFLPENSNILAFQRKYTPYASESEGTEVFNFVFKLVTRDYNDIPEDTSLQRVLKKHYLDGNYIYEYEGIFVDE